MINATSHSFTRLLPLAFLNFSVGAGAFFIIGLIGPLSSALSLTKVQAGWIMGVYALSYALTSPVLVSLSGNRPRRDVMLTGTIIFIAASVASGFAWDATSLYAARIAAAIGAGLITPVVAAVAAGSTTPDRRGAALSIVFTGMTLSQVVGVPGGAFIGFTLGPRAAFFCAAALCVVAAFAVLVATPRDVSSAPQSLRTLARTLARPRDLVAILLTVMITTSGYIGMVFLGPLAEMRFGMGRDGVALFLFATGIGAVVGNVFGGFFVDRLGATATLALAIVGQVVAAPLLTCVPFGLPLGLAIAFLWSIFGWGWTVPQQARLIALDPAASGVMLALNAAGIYLGTGIGAAIAGFVNQNYGIEATGIVSGALAVVALAHLALSEWLVRRSPPPSEKLA